MDGKGRKAGRDDDDDEDGRRLIGVLGRLTWSSVPPSTPQGLRCHGQAALLVLLRLSSVRGHDG